MILHMWRAQTAQHRGGILSTSGETGWTAMTKLADRIDGVTGEINQKLARLRTSLEHATGIELQPLTHNTREAG